MAVYLSHLKSGEIKNTRDFVVSHRTFGAILFYESLLLALLGLPVLRLD
jgi:hypothetical protein